MIAHPCLVRLFVIYLQLGAGPGTALVMSLLVVIGTLLPLIEDHADDAGSPAAIVTMVGLLFAISGFVASGMIYIALRFHTSSLVAFVRALLSRLWPAVGNAAATDWLRSHVLHALLACKRGPVVGMSDFFSIAPCSVPAPIPVGLLPSSQRNLHASRRVRSRLPGGGQYPRRAAASRHNTPALRLMSRLPPAPRKYEESQRVPILIRQQFLLPPLLALPEQAATAMEQRSHGARCTRLVRWACSNQNSRRKLLIRWEGKGRKLAT